MAPSNGAPQSAGDKPVGRREAIPNAIKRAWIGCRSEPRCGERHAECHHECCLSADPHRWRLRTRSIGYQDLVSNNNALLAVMQRKGLWQTYSGPRIRQTLQISKQIAQWYSGYDQLLNPAIDLFNDAFFDPKMVVVPVILSMQEILNNEGEAQLMDVYDSYMTAAERALEDTMDAGALRRRHRQRRQADHRPGDRGADRHQHRHLRRHRSRHRHRSGRPRPTTRTLDARRRSARRSRRPPSARCSTTS